MTSRKVLLSGDVHGKFNNLFKRVASVNKANGPFDFLLCTGVFTARPGEWYAGGLCSLDTQNQD